jgi:histidyl-tRNA synthetase
VTVVGSDERAAGHVTVKDMDSGTQTVLPRQEAPAWIALAARGEPSSMTR